MTIQAGDKLRVVTQFLTSNNDFSENVWHFVATAVADGDDDEVMNDIRDAFETAFETYLNGHVHGDVNAHTILFYLAVNGSDLYLPFGERTWTITMSTNSEPLPLNAAGLVRFGVLNGRRPAGKYVVGLNESSQNMSRLNSAAILALGAWGINIADGLSMPTATYVPMLPDTDAGYDSFSGSVVVREIVASQRRRKPGVGS